MKLERTIKMKKEAGDFRYEFEDELRETPNCFFSWRIDCKEYLLNIFLNGRNERRLLT